MPEYISPQDPREASAAIASSSSAAANFQPPSQLEPIQARGKTIFIDNYDSFTYNVVQYLSELGADIIVYRNDEVSIEEIEAQSPVNIVISPGPGHPLKDSGISIPLIKHFAGKIPILGVCMGLQCIYSSYSGVVNFAGEILHGKTSPIEHDARGLYSNLGKNDVVGTRYHSLAAKIDTLPKELVVTSRTESGVVMGIRHTKFAIEAVQYHPESILSKGGKEMFRNFLSWTSGEWEGNPQAKIDENAKRLAESTKEPTLAMNGEGVAVGAAAGAGAVGSAGLVGAAVANSSSGSTNGKSGSVGTILERIHVQRLKDIAFSKSQPGLSPADLLRSLALHLAPPLIDFPSRLTAHASSGLPGVMAEMKRASPSKGDIDPLAHAGFQALSYAKGGASVISVLTEPKWFKGSLNDLRLARDAVASLPRRPALLRKDFIVDTYQIVEARLAGADTVLLIVAMLDDVLLKELYDYSRSLGMEPLVEVNNPEEMNRALAIGAKVVGVNNRNLHDFNVDMGTTSRLAEIAKERGIILCALSGITGRKDVEKYVSEGVGAVLVGEALMRSKDKKAFIHDLLGLDPDLSPTKSSTSAIPPSLSTSSASPNSLNGLPTSSDPSVPLVKICGISTTDAALAAVLAGADMIGMILAPGTRRSLSLQQAADISAVVRSIRGGWDNVRNVAAEESNKALILKAQNQINPNSSAAEIQSPEISTPTWFNHYSNQLRSLPHKPLLVGVFRNQPLDEVVNTAKILKLDVVQLHGRIEEIEWSKWLPGVYVIRVFHVDASATSSSTTSASLSSSNLRDIHRPTYHHISALDTAGSKSSTTNGDGGSGQTFDWSIAHSLAYPQSLSGLERERESNPIMLAGGLTPENVGDAIKALAPTGAHAALIPALLAVDTSSGVENEKGEKDNDKIREFVRRAKTALL